jgi:hypothetical protein
VGLFSGGLEGGSGGGCWIGRVENAEKVGTRTHFGRWLLRRPELAAMRGVNLSVSMWKEGLECTVRLIGH